ncbi:hypothetical protein [Actinoplanes derwentensis]|uniref:hypothetical protein n=1 Tax=Actinoplanes derwentensis TaxID=113562 RepID=UPI000B85E731|nr:hypothetical protein [Actinoplanes derwentensis]GID86717.1 hypothetical protein Ade03nite_56410 [Actinoplanes derwentensis]
MALLLKTESGKHARIAVERPHRPVTASDPLGIARVTEDATAHTEWPGGISVIVMRLAVRTQPPVRLAALAALGDGEV